MRINAKGNAGLLRQPARVLRACGACTYLLAIILLTPAAAHAAPVSYGDIVVNADPEQAINSAHGYTEYWITVTNRSSERTHRIELGLPKHDGIFGGREDHIRSITRGGIEVGPGATVRVALLHPSRPASGGQGLSVTIDGRTQDDFVPFNMMGGSLYLGRPAGGAVALNILHSPGVSDAFLKQAQRRFGGGTGMAIPGGGMPAGGMGMGGPGGPPGAFVPPVVGIGPPVPAMKAPSATLPPPPPGGEAGEPGEELFPPSGGMGGPGGMPGPGSYLNPANLIRAPAPPPLWSPNWLGYSRYDGIIITADELRTVRSEIQTALWQYTEAGGSLLILGAGGKLPEGWKRRQSAGQGFTVYEAGFGVCSTTDDANYDKWPEQRWRILSGEWMNTLTPFTTVRGVADAHSLFPVVDNIGIPVGGLFLLMMVFALTIGPANLLVLSRLKKRIWLLWTVPVLSLATCLAVFGYMAVSEGWQGHIKTEAVTVLDETSHRAATIGYTGFYAPLTLGDGLHFSTETELSPQAQEDTRMGYSRSGGGGGGGGSPCTLDWSVDQHLARGWVKPRVPAYFMARKSESRRERVAVTRARDGSLSAVNGLGVDVQKLWYADEQGQVYSTGPVTAGAQAILSPTGDKLEGNKAKTPSREVFIGDWIRVVSTTTTNPKNYLYPRSYLAVMEDTPFLEDGLKNAKSRKCRSVVIGFPHAESDE